MRIKMSCLFSNYTKTFPDRYYYACNIIFVIMLLYSLYLLGNQVRYTKAINCYGIFLIIMFLANGNLFFTNNKDDLFLGASSECFEFSDSLSYAFNKNTIHDGKYVIEVAPSSWPNIELAPIYVLTSINENNKENK